MKVNQLDGSAERRILTAMIVDDTVLGRIASRWVGRPFLSTWANVIGELCVTYYKRHRKAPRKTVQSLCEDWAHSNKDAASKSLVESFLESLSAEYETDGGELNAEHVLDEAGKYFNRVKLSRLSDQITGDLDTGNLEKAEQRVTNWHRVELGAGSGVDFFQDEQAIASCFKRQQESLFQYPGALGRFFGHDFRRNAFIAFLAPEKSTKSFWLQDVAMRAMMQRRKVAFFETGDMPEEELGQRLLARVAEVPYDNPDGKWPYAVKYPTAIASPPEGIGVAKVEHEIRTFDGPLDEATALKAAKVFQKTTIKSNKSYFRLSCNPTNTISVIGIRSVLESWALDGFEPDVVVIDYADLIAPIDRKLDRRDQINETWAALSTLRQELHICVVTATQADADSYERKTLGRKNFSEDKRKLAHVTGMVGINVTAEEKANGICRLNWIGRRRGASHRVVHVAQCLPLAMPAVVSCFGKSPK